MHTIIIFILIALVSSMGAFAAESNAPVTFRVMSYNIHHGEGTDQKIDLKRIAALIRREKADIVGLQEIDRGTARTSHRDLIKELSELTQMDFYFERNIVFQGGDYGNAVLTRFPILEKTNRHYKMLRPGEQRGIQQVLLNVHGKKLLFMNTHIDYRPQDDERMVNVQELRQLFADRQDLPIILSGDFNDTPDSRVYQNLAAFLRDGWKLAGQGPGLTFSSDQMEKRIDYLWLSSHPAIKPLKLWVPHSNASDHLPVVGEFELH